jgi:hypothetical protein
VALIVALIVELNVAHLREQNSLGSVWTRLAQKETAHLSICPSVRLSTCLPAMEGDVLTADDD